MGGAMKNHKFIILVLIISLSLIFPFSAQAGEHYVNWTLFNLNLVKAIQSNHPGLQQSAMKHIIHYSDSLNAEDAIYPVGQIFRFHKDPQMRRLAMIALSKINNDNALDILCNYSKFEENPSIKRQCCQIIKKYYLANHPEKVKEFEVQ
jgi:hypothetical protein